MEQSNKTFLIIIIALIALVLGAFGGYYYGNKVGVEKGLSQDQSTPEQVEVEAAAEALKEIQDAANPFSDAENSANPFKDAYQNPFTQ